MKQADSWLQHCEQITSFIRQNKRCPSKHREEEHRMLNWIKYNKKMKAMGRMSEDRVALFDALLELSRQYRRVNQHVYETLAPYGTDACEKSVMPLFPDL